MFSRAPPLRWLLPPPRPIQPSQTPRCLPQPWYLWGICVGEAAPLDQHNLMPVGRGCQAPPPPPCTNAERNIHILRHTDTHADTHDTVGVLLAPERVWKDGVSCSGPQRTFRANWRPVVLKPSWATTAILAPCLPGGPHRDPLKHWPRQRIGGVCLTPVAPLSLLLSRQHREHSHQK